jgi:hypothetical protein
MKVSMIPDDSIVAEMIALAAEDDEDDEPIVDFAEGKSTSTSPISPSPSPSLQLEHYYSPCSILIHVHF